MRRKRSSRPWPAFAQDAASQPGVPVVVTCEPNQRTLVRPMLVNGAAMSQVECVSSAQGQGYASAEPTAIAQPIPAGVRYRQVASRAAQPVAAEQDDGDLANTRVVPVDPAPRARWRGRSMRSRLFMTIDRCGGRRSAPRRRARSSLDRRPVRVPGLAARSAGKRVRSSARSLAAAVRRSGIR